MRLQSIHLSTQNSLITVGKRPEHMGINLDANTIYVANSGNTVFVIDGKVCRVPVRLMFNTEPFNVDSPDFHF